MDSLIGFGAWDVQDMWVRSAADAVLWVMVGWGVVITAVLLLATLVVAVGRRRFWCDQAQREVAVDFQENGFPGFRRPVAVLRCSAFQPPTAITCCRSCLEQPAGLSAPR
jgi:hypothetical protein